MKYSFMSFSSTDLTLDETICLAKKIGYDSIELRLNSNHKHNVEVTSTKEELEAVKKLLKDNQFSICCIATSCVFCDPKTRAKNIQDGKDAIDLAVNLGVKKLRVFGGSYPETISYEDAFNGLVAALTELSDYIGENDVTLCVETHDSWCNPSNVIDVINAVNRKNIKVNWDIMHTALTAKKTMTETFEILKGTIEHVHIHDGIRPEGALTFLPIGKGEVDHNVALKLLSDSNYQGYLSGEWISWDEPNYLATELKKLKKLKEIEETCV